MTAAEFNDFVVALEELEQQAHRSGMHATAHAINAAKNQAGWERADQLTRAAHQQGAAQE